jgi:hypothetical protein
MSIIFIITSFKPLKKSTTGFAFSSSIKIRTDTKKNYEKYNLQHAPIVTQSFEKIIWNDINKRLKRTILLALAAISIFWEASTEKFWLNFLSILY